ncbi:MAG: AlpA family phage regulatory protein [Pseudohongiellaceae bacterium]|nr:AlpA family phage regulatory protein [Pseudohongiellaceae bacterium]
MTTIRYMRRPEVLQKIGVSNSTLHSQILKGLFVPPISLGARSVGWLEHEVNAVLIMRAQGKSEGEIKILVRRMVKERKQAQIKEGASNA